jgi:putative tryptophan/tyrosine transport system substrate-binding protein
MRRRDFIILAMAIGPAVSAPLFVRAQQTTKVYRIAIVAPATPAADLTETGGSRALRGFFAELRRLGYVEGRNLVVERYSGEGRSEHFSELARDVVRSNPDVIYAFANPMVSAFKAATTTVPIVGAVGDPILSGFASSLARPGGNITGVSVDAGIEIVGKRLALLKEIIPRMSRVAFLMTRSSWDSPYGISARELLERSGVTLVGAPLDGPADEVGYRRVFGAISHDGADALIVGDDSEHFTNRHLIVALAEQSRLPTIYGYREHAEVGGLMAYAWDFVGLSRQAADQVDQILKGTKPSDIPFYQSSKFELVINLKTAKVLGLTVPDSLLARADEIIE